MRDFDTCLCAICTEARRAKRGMDMGAIAFALAICIMAALAFLPALIGRTH